MPSTSSSPPVERGSTPYASLVRARLVLVGQRERQLLARRAEAARRAVERLERRVLHEAVDPAGRRAASRGAHGSAITTGSGATDGRTIAWTAGSASAATATPSAIVRPARRAGEHRDRAEQREPARDQERDPERVVDPREQRVVGALGQPRVLARVLRVVGEAARLGVERSRSAVARVRRVEVGDERPGQLELVERRQPRVEDQRRAALPHVGDRAVELRGGDRREQRAARA